MPASGRFEPARTKTSMSTPPRPLPPKKDVALALLQGPSLFIHLDPRKPEVIVPLHFKKQAQLVLQVGLNMAVPIPDLHVDDEGVSCTLSFNRSPFWCRLPWSAIYALVGDDKRGMIWPDEVPAEVENAQRPKGADAQPAAAKRGPRGSKKRERPPREEEARAAGELQSSEAASGREMRASARPLAPLPVSPRPLSPTAPTARSAAAPSTKGTGDAAKPGKRELPPYLRVVK
jgi:stringent starvation protein B